ncbi:hypothetical protein V8E36_008367 [Tilletia maclaganii]
MRPGDRRRGLHGLTAATGDGQGNVSYSHIRYSPPEPTPGAGEQLDALVGADLTPSDLLETAELLYFEASDASISFNDELRKAILDLSPRQIAEDRFKGLTKAGILLFQHVRDGTDVPRATTRSDLGSQYTGIGTYAGLGHAARIVGVDLRSASTGRSEALNLPSSPDVYNICYTGRALWDVSMRTRQHRAEIKKTKTKAASLHYDVAAQCSHFDYVVIGIPPTNNKLSPRLLTVLWELFDARFLNTWTGNAVDTLRNALAQPRRKWSMLGLNSTPIREGFTSTPLKFSPAFWSNADARMRHSGARIEGVEVEADWRQEMEPKMLELVERFKMVQAKLLLDGRLVIKQPAPLKHNRTRCIKLLTGTLWIPGDGLRGLRTRLRRPSYPATLVCEGSGDRANHVGQVSFHTRPDTPSRHRYPAPIQGREVDHGGASPAHV